VDPQRSSRGIQPSGNGVRARHSVDPIGPRRGAGSPVAGCTFSGSRATTGSRAARSPGTEGDSRRSLVCESYSRPGWARPFGGRGSRRTPRSRVGSSSDRLPSPLLAVRGDCGAGTPRPAARGNCEGSVANRSVLHPTRLETRTKESNMCASHGARTKPKGATKVREASGRPRQDPGPHRGAGRTAGPSRRHRPRGGARAHTLGPERW
jgi:hypothetical protein